MLMHPLEELAKAVYELGGVDFAGAMSWNEAYPHDRKAARDFALDLAETLHRLGWRSPHAPLNEE